MFGREFANNKCGEANDGKHTQRADEIGAEPVVFLPLVQHDLQAGNAERQVSHSPKIDLRGRALDVGRIKDKNASQKNCENANRDIDIEDPAPAITVSKPSSQDGTKHWRNHDAQPPETHSLAAILRRKDFHQNGLGERLQSASTGSLNTLASKEVRQPSRHGKNDGVGNQIRSQRPGCFIRSCRKASSNVRQRDVDDGGVQHLHKGAGHYGNRDQPRIYFIPCSRRAALYRLTCCCHLGGTL